MLDELLGSKLRAKVLGWLFTHPEERYFVRQLTTLLAEDSTNISRELSRLERIGILRSEREGRQKYYRADRQCPIFSELQGIALKTAGMADVLRTALRPLAGKIKAAFVYGSMASGKGNARSDVDVMVIGHVTFADIVSALAPAQEALGREINPTVYAPEEFRHKVAARHHFVTSVLADSKVFLVGGPDELAGLAQ